MKNVFDLKTAQHMGQPPQIQNVRDIKTYCPKCKTEMAFPNVMNPSNPAIYQCHKCGYRFNPDNEPESRTPGMSKSVSQTPGMAGNGGLDSAGLGDSYASGKSRYKVAQRGYRPVQTEWDDMVASDLHGKFAVLARHTDGTEYIEDVVDTEKDARAAAEAFNARYPGHTAEARVLDQNIDDSYIIAYIGNKRDEALDDIEDARFADEENARDYGDGEYDNIDGAGFADPGGNSALRAETEDNPRNLPCPNCGRPNMLTPVDAQKGYQCNHCADQAEGRYGSSKKSVFNLKKAQQQLMNAKTKQSINQKFVSVGLDGNGRFEKPGRILNAIGDVLSGFGMTLTDTQDLHSFPENQPRAVIKSLRVNMAATEDPFTPGPEVGSQVHVQYTMLAPYQYEAVAYMT